MAILHLCRHSLELYFKGAIGYTREEIPRNSHRLSYLFDRFKLLYPSPEYLPELPFDEEVFRTDDFFPESLEPFHRTHDQRFRYPSDTKGQPFDAFRPYDVDEKAELIAKFWQSLVIIVLEITGRERADV
ncbi:hypothetical protein [Pandoraea communis]|uniref:hypothetical protein n=1 Tax=Pandoraea communis TaxID=2508297 RepID=UPI001240B1FA|nr:hypothetical protein [Pandoraea communis]